MNPIQFSLVTPPKLAVYDRLSILSFISEWDQYQADVLRLNSSFAPSPTASGGYSAVPLRDCIEQSLFRSMCRYSMGIPQAKIASVTDQDILTHLKTHINEVVAVPVDVKQLFKNVKFAHYDDALRSVYDIFGQCDDVIASYGLSSLFDEHADLRSKQIDAIISAIYPDSLRDSLRNRLNLDKIDCKSDLAKFFSFFVDTLKSYRLFNPVSSIPSSPTRFIRTPTSFSPRQPLRCFHCSGDHHIKNCPKCPTEDVSRILAESAARRRSSILTPHQTASVQSELPSPNRTFKKTTTPSFASPTLSSMAALRPPLHPQSPSSSPAPKTPVKPEHRVNRVLPASPDSVNDFWVKPYMLESSGSLISQSARERSVSDSQGNDIDRLSAVRIAVLDKLFEFPAALDDGADMTLIGSNIWEVLQNTGISFSPESIEFKLADGSISSVSKSFRVDLQLQTSSGSVIARHQKVFVADVFLPDVSLGRPLLLSLGIDVERQLCGLASRSFSSNCPDPASSGGKNFNDRDLEHFEIGPVNKTEVSEALRDAVSLITNIAPALFVSDLEKLLFEFSDIFRVNLGPDLPVDIEPAVLKLLPGTQASLCKPRPFRLSILIF